MIKKMGDRTRGLSTGVVESCSLSFCRTTFLSDDVPISIAFLPDIRVAIKAFPVGEKNEGCKKDGHCNN